MSRNSITIRPVFGEVTYEVNPNFIFVLMPFTEKFSKTIYKELKEICTSLNFEIMRADDFILPGNIIDDIWEGINKAGIIIADITVHNPNVFYELGIAHTLGKDVILIRGDDALRSPFDISAKRYVDYSIYDTEKFKQDISSILKAYKQKNNL